MRIFITGASGFIGGYLAERLLTKKEHDVAVLVRQTSNMNMSRIQHLGALGALVYYGGLTDAFAISYAFRDFQPEVICHLGALTPVAKSFDNVHGYAETNVMGSVVLLEEARRNVPHLKRFIFSSSMETYGALYSKEVLEKTQKSEKGYTMEIDGIPPVTEKDFDLSAVGSPYAATKVFMEALLNVYKYSYNFPFVAFRQTNAYGRRDNNYFIVERILTQMLENDKIRLGDPRPVRNFIFIDDLLDLWEKVIFWPDDSIHGHVFNTGPANGLSIGALADKIAGQLDWKGSVEWNTMPRRPGEVFYLNSTSEKAERMLGFKHNVDLDTGIARTIDIWKKKLAQKSA